MIIISKVSLSTNHQYEYVVTSIYVRVGPADAVVIGQSQETICWNVKIQNKKNNIYQIPANFAMDNDDNYGMQYWSFLFSWP